MLAVFPKWSISIALTLTTLIFILFDMKTEFKLKLEECNENIWITARDLELLRPINFRSSYWRKLWHGWTTKNRSEMDRVATITDRSYLSLNYRSVLRFIAYYKQTAPLNKSRQSKDQNGNVVN